MAGMRPGASPLGEQISIVVLGPPIMALLWRIGSRGWAHTIQGATLSEKTKKRQNIEFWALLVLMYMVVIGMVIYAEFQSEALPSHRQCAQ